MITESRLKTKKLKNNNKQKRRPLCPKAKAGEHFKKGVKCSQKKELAQGLGMWPVGGAW